MKCYCRRWITFKKMIEELEAWGVNTDKLSREEIIQKYADFFNTFVIEL